MKHRPTKNANGTLKNRRPQASEIKACKPWLHEQVELVNPSLIVPLGNVATQTILDAKAKIGEVHGRPSERDGRMIIPNVPSRVCPAQPAADGGLPKGLRENRGRLQTPSGLDHPASAGLSRVVSLGTSSTPSCQHVSQRRTSDERRALPVVSASQRP